VFLFRLILRLHFLRYKKQERFKVLSLMFGQGRDLHLICV